MKFVTDLRAGTNAETSENGAFEMRLVNSELIFSWWQFNPEFTIVVRFQVPLTIAAFDRNLCLGNFGPMWVNN